MFFEQFASAMAAAACWLPELAHAAAIREPAVRFPSAERERIAVTTYPFREYRTRMAAAQRLCGPNPIEMEGTL